MGRLEPVETVRGGDRGRLAAVGGVSQGGKSVWGSLALTGAKPAKPSKTAKAICQNFLTLFRVPHSVHSQHHQRSPVMCFPHPHLSLSVYTEQAFLKMWTG